ncbi:hypothetical protein [Endozoicomonas sp. SCSIO W0465]|uniref:hypothetical protein n=1 Tax=Endozoicomonas sp. SCSIO W0465 TaxID=2918516 RepID=UPI002075ECC4|nr:hypothetical protein [Endozoicomonas sp. SCSIO W0465]USE39526.1 hypothetical protein MJO57_15990 [Endozoicomonas sp. SCSIO W0465]
MNELDERAGEIKKNIDDMVIHLPNVSPTEAWEMPFQQRKTLIESYNKKIKKENDSMNK